MPDVPDAVIWYSGFGAPDYLQSSVAIDQQVTEFASVDEARAHYATWEASLFPTETWRVPEGFEFSPGNSGDRFKLACVPTSLSQPSRLACRHLQQHENIVSILMANIDESHLTLAQVNIIINDLDARLAVYAGPSIAITPGTFVEATAAISTAGPGAVAAHQIAFVSTVNSKFGIFVTDLAGNAMVKVSDSNANDWSPAWSPAANTWPLHPIGRAAPISL
jgi:hypothetical protein